MLQNELLGFGVGEKEKKSNVVQGSWTKVEIERGDERYIEKGEIGDESGGWR